MAVTQSLYLTQESQDIIANSSTVRILWQSRQTGESYNLIERIAYYYVSINGAAEVEYSVNYKLPINTLQTIVDTTIEVPHTSDGRGTVSVRTWMDTRISAGVVQLEKSLDLTQIARASTIGATDADIESVSSIIVSRKSAMYSHSIHVQFGAWSSYLLADGSLSFDEARIFANNVAFMVPSSFYAQIPNSDSGVCTLTCQTYLGLTRIGEAQTATFTVTANREKCAPVLEWSIADVNAATLALTKDPSALVRYMSTARCALSASARNSATIVSTSIADSEAPEGSLDLVNVESDLISFSATDSRGYTTRVEVPVNLIAYTRLTANVQLARTTPTSGKVSLTIKGDYYNGVFGVTGNNLTLEYRVARVGATYGDSYPIVPTIEGDAYVASTILSDIDYEYAYNVQVIAKDALSSVEKVVTVSQGIPVFDWGEKDFRFNVPIMLPACCYGATPPTSGKLGQLFLQKNPDEDGFVIRVYDGTSWQ